MKKLSLRIAILTAIVLAVGVMLSGVAVAKSVKQDVCHLKGNGDVISIRVDESAVPAHLAHGDYLPGTLMNGQYACADCSLVDTVIVESATLNFGPTGWGGWSDPSAGSVVDCTFTSVGGTGNGDLAQVILWAPGATADSVSYPATPFGYTYTPPEEGCIAQNDNDQDQIKLFVVYANCNGNGD